MGTLIQSRHVFLASPGDVDRDLIREVIESFNEEVAEAAGVIFRSRGWESLGSTVGRPQHVINEQVLAQCDYMVLVLSARWGTPPQLGAGYESGTEEEFHEALRLLADPAAPMRNLCVLFQQLPEAVAANPDADAQKVLEFRDVLEQSKSILYSVFDSPLSFDRGLKRALGSWVSETGQKMPALVRLVAPTNLVERSMPELSWLQQAEEQAALGQTTRADLSYARAINEGTSDAYLSYITYLRRTGRFATSIAIATDFFGSLDLSGKASPSDNAVRARAMANIGVAQRKIGKLNASQVSLEEALRFAQQSDNVDLIPYIRDNLGHTLNAAGLAGLSRDQFTLASNARGDGESTLPQSLVNEARLLLRTKDRTTALSKVNEALNLLENMEDIRLLAAAFSLRGRVYFELKDYAKAQTDATRSADLNAEISNADGRSIAQVLLARATLALGDPAGAGEAALAAYLRNIETGSLAGQASAQHVRAMAALAQGENDLAAELADGALQLATQSGNAGILNAVSRWITNDLQSL